MSETQSPTWPGEALHSGGAIPAFRLDISSQPSVPPCFPETGTQSTPAK